ncbi:MAG TPA: TRAP transporter substrate-binding protein DctP [Halanaerobiales bacterium]|nr:TRAP transporter substrate-binding protein DctP [Halanaerobiales bacterium]
MKKLIFTLSFILLITMLFSGSLLAQDQIVMKMAIGDSKYINVGDETIPFITYAQMSVFKNVVEQLSNGQISAEIYAGGTLGDDRTVLEQLKKGVIHGVATNEGVLPNWYKPIQVVALPYVLNNELVAWKVFDGEFGQKMFDDMAEKTDFRVISVGSNGGFRMFANNVRPLRKPEDFEGLKIRTQQIPAQMELVKGQGASPTAVSWPEVYSALQTGVVDGAELPVVGAVAQNHHEVVDYITLDKHLFSPMFIVINETWYRDLDPELQRAVKVAGEMAGTASRGMSQYSLSKVVSFFRDQGIEVTTLTEEEREVLKENSYSKVRDWLEERVDEEWITGFEQAVAEAQSEISE